jgi:hypothetical protein
VITVHSRSGSTFQVSFNTCRNGLRGSDCAGSRSILGSSRRSKRWHRRQSSSSSAPRTKPSRGARMGPRFRNGAFPSASRRKTKPRNMFADCCCSLSYLRIEAYLRSPTAECGSSTRNPPRSTAASCQSRSGDGCLAQEVWRVFRSRTV